MLLLRLDLPVQVPFDQSQLLKENEEYVTSAIGVNGLVLKASGVIFHLLVSLYLYLDSLEEEHKELAKAAEPGSPALMLLTS